MSVEGTIERVLKTGQLWGQDDKALSRGGDAGAVVLTSIFADKALTDDEIGRIVGIVSSCFYNLAWVEKPADREPRTALLLLRYMDYQAHTPDVKKMIGEVRKAILDRYAAYQKQQHSTPAVGP